MTVETLSKVRRLFHIQGWSLRKISRELHISRNTVRKALQSGTTKFSYKRQHQSYPRLGRFQSDLDRLLMSNIGKPRRERLTLVRIYEELCSLGFEGSYSCIRHYAQIFSKAHNHTSAAVFIPLIFAPGEAYQFDWSHEIVILNGVTTAVKIAHVRLCNSRMFYIRAYLREAQEMVFDAHDRAFAFFHGSCRRGIYDNMRTAVDAILVGKDRQFNRRFLQMCSHYLVEPTACTPAAGWGEADKQSIEYRLPAERP